MFSGSCTPMKNLNENTGQRREDLENIGVGDKKPVSARVVISPVLFYYFTKSYSLEQIVL